jgi:hypothetical protein
MRASGILLGVFLAALLTAAFPMLPATARPRAAIAYGPGWNLVSGPGGSTLAGATGSLYTLQPGDTDYRSFPIDSTLQAGWGYWAYFPNGGSLASSSDGNRYSVSLMNGAWTMVGDPSASLPATVAGADQVLLYTAASGYQPFSFIPPGQAAWISGSGTVSVSVVSPTGSTTVASPLPASNAPSPVVGVAMLRAAALQPADLPGYQSLGESSGLPTAGAVAVYSQGFRDTTPGTFRFGVAELLTSFPTTGAAHAAVNGVLAALLGGAMHVSLQNLGSAGVGDEDHEYHYIDLTYPGYRLDDYTVIVRHANVLAVITTLDQPGTSSLATALAYARTVDFRLGLITGQ